MSRLLHRTFRRRKRPTSSQPGRWLVAAALTALLAPACGPSGTVVPRDLLDASIGQPPNLSRPTDGGAAIVDLGSADLGGQPTARLDASADLAMVDVAPTEDRPADATAPVDRPPDLPAADSPLPDLPPPPDVGPDLAPDGPIFTDRPGPWVMVSHEPAQPLTNLTSSGNVDWVHFGQGGVSRVNRKSGVPARIAMTPIGEATLYGYNDRPVRFAWEDGMPTSRMMTTADGISIGEATGRGFELRVQGNVARARVLRVYLGVWGARAQFFTRFNDESVPAVTDTSLTAGQPGRDRITTIVFRPASAGQVLLVRWTVETVNQTYGNVTLQAASLSE